MHKPGPSSGEGRALEHKARGAFVAPVYSIRAALVFAVAVTSGSSRIGHDPLQRRISFLGLGTSSGGPCSSEPSPKALDIASNLPLGSRAGAFSPKI